MQGRLLGFQQHPSECCTNYGGACAFRSNLDVQDLRRVSSAEAWLDDDEVLPHLGDRPQWGYMNTYELNDGDDYVARPRLPQG
eukprot:7056761-Lingulodinium_polyedra.AAC.1